MKASDLEISKVDNPPQPPRPPILRNTKKPKLSQSNKEKKDPVKLLLDRLREIESNNKPDMVINNADN